jgi:predicted short-subunit dehydrogenase-like oxidoreductase (DUF2520 family)
MKPSFAIVGCGKVGTALGIFLTRRGYRAVGLYSRSLSSARQLAESVGEKCVFEKPWEAARQADTVFITTPDDAIQGTCDRISQAGGFKNTARVFHCSGALPSTILASAKTCDAIIASMHPLQSFASADFTENPFKNIIIAVEGEKQAVQAAEEIANDLGAKSIQIATAGKTLYHAAAVVASNYLVALLDHALKLMHRAGISGQDALMVLKPLIDGTLSNISKVGIPAALTGPIARGDIKTVTDHLDAMRSLAPQLVQLYQVLGSHTVGIASAKGTLSESAAQELTTLLKPGSSSG